MIGRIWAIAVNTAREAIRNKLLYTFLFFALAMMLFGVVLATISYVERERMMQDFAFASIRLFSVAIAIFVGVGLIHKDIDRRTVYTILSKPLSRAEFLIGKFTGLILIIWLQVAIMALFFAGGSLLMGAPLGFTHLAALALIEEERGDLVLQLAFGEQGSLLKTLDGLQRVKLGAGIQGTVAQSGLAVMLKDCREHPGYNPVYDKRTGFSAGPIICAPIRNEEKILGSCSVIRRRERGVAFTAKDLALFNLFCESAALAIRNAKVHQALMDNQKLHTDMEFSRSVQQSFLPDTFPKHRHYLFAGKTIPTQAVGGDFFDFIPYDKDTVGILLGDVSGKGFPAALHMARLMSDFRFASLALREPAKILTEVNKILCERGRAQGMFTTVLFLSLDMKNHVVRAANGGHHPLVHRDANGRLHTRAAASGPPLGILPDTVYEQTQFTLKSGDRVFLFSDGLLEVQNARKKFFGIKKVRDFCRKQNLKPKSFLIELQKHLKEFSGNHPQFDDITIVAFQQK
ncbi:MAG: SpoIIE family protein phosphatase [Nitrospinae bacterium]|nr:SpoIIE family protein phosphatase [Nitrospinota bacterium]